MRTVFKYPLALVDVQEVELPAEAEILHVAEQLGSLMLWANVETDNDLVSRRLAVVGTGHHAPSPTEARHIGTVLTGIGLVWHIFEELEEA
jgi:hypothetical protein